MQFLIYFVLYIQLVGYCGLPGKDFFFFFLFFFLMFIFHFSSTYPAITTNSAQPLLYSPEFASLTLQLHFCFYKASYGTTSSCDLLLQKAERGLITY